MKLPRGVTADRLIRALEHLGYGVARRKGSHVRAPAPGPSGSHHYGPLHNPPKIGTLHEILAEVAQMRSVTVEWLSELLSCTRSNNADLNVVTPTPNCSKPPNLFAPQL
jgi:predicted RNA binding protein YcfA (HicA-like mRNA interferase family)